MKIRRLQIDAHGCDTDLLEARDLLNAMTEGASRAKATIRQQVVEPFNPHGVTLVLILAESHFVVSTWPEFGFVTLDAALCNEQLDIELLVLPMLEWLKPERIERQFGTTLVVKPG